MNKRRVFISGVGLVTGLGTGLDELWQGLLAGRSTIGPVTAFDASGFPCRIAAALPTAQIKDFVPKSYRKATKVMARDTELAVIAADLAARQAGVATPGTHPEEGATRTYAAERSSCHIGASLIAAELDELTYALKASAASGSFDIHHWGKEGMQNLTPLWMLKYLPNMLACHVTIVHDLQGASNTITCSEASSGLSIGESLRVIQRGDSDCGFCGGATSRLNPMSLLREVFTNRMITDDAIQAGDATQAVRPFDTAACGTALGDGGGILVLEAADTLTARGGQAMAEVLGFGASQSLNRANRNTVPTEDGRGVRLAIEAALRDANLSAADIDVILPTGLGHGESDRAEAAALRAVFGERLAQVPVYSPKAAIGNTLAGAGAVDVGVAVKILQTGNLPPIQNRSDPLPGLTATTLAKAPTHALCVSAGFCGQNAAIVLKKA